MKELGQYTDMLSSIPVGIYILSSEYKFLYVSPVWESLNGISSNEVIDNPHLAFEIIHPHDLANFKAKLKNSIHTISSFDIEVRFIKNDEIRWMRLNSNPSKNESGEWVWFGAQTDITEKKEMESSLIESKLMLDKAIEKYKRANEVKSEFLTNMSHEIRTPLNGIMGFTSLMKTTAMDSMQQEYINLISDSSKSLLRIVQDILLFNEIQSGEVSIPYEFVSIRKLLQKLQKQFSINAEKKNIGLEFIIPHDCPSQLYISESKFSKVLEHLLDNAIKFTHQGNVTLTMEWTPNFNYTAGDFTFHIKDTGIGIREEHLPLLFKPFTQVDSSMTKRYPGTGLGLIICDSLAKLLNAEITLESIENQGSCFSISFETKITNETNKDVAPEISISNPSSTLGKIRFLESSPTILIAEDVDINLLYVRRLVKKFAPNSNILEARNGREALGFINQYYPDLILMDIQMPEMDGLETAKIIRESEDVGKRNIPIIALSAGVLQEQKDACLKSGMNGFLPKPIDSQEFNEILTKYLIPQ
ncbi:MAG: response regulator [Leptospira sp.]|nr:response regulator [Leptospira sp.]